MRWIAIALGLVATLAALIAVIAVIGMLLPQAHVAARVARYGEPPDRIFAIVTDFAQTPTWRPGVTRVEMLPPEAGQIRFREHGSDPVTYRVEVIDPPRRLVVRIADTNLPYGGAWTYDFAASPDGGTQLTITERGEVYNPVFRFLSRFVFSHHETIDAYLRALGAKLGQPVIPEPSTTAAIAPPAA